MNRRVVTAWLRLVARRWTSIWGLNSIALQVAERVGFEPTIELPLYLFSSSLSIVLKCIVLCGDMPSHTCSSHEIEKDRTNRGIAAPSVVGNYVGNSP